MKLIKNLGNSGRVELLMSTSSSSSVSCGSDGGSGSDDVGGDANGGEVRAAASSLGKR